ncbi:hypothetical protein FRB90_006240 [Tulasnella sp. 427]|nr:hypothetical protein FRB90_006240 [Tulasnella sp. 427]
MDSQGMQPVYGNYQGYYTKRPSVFDPRLSLFPPSFFKNKDVLDVGCNEGWVSIELAQRWGANRVVGVDIDPDLVAGAWKKRRTAWSMQAPIANEQRLAVHSPLGVQSLDVSEYPASLPYTYGSLPELSTVSPRMELEGSLAEDRPQSAEESHFPLSMIHSFGPLPLSLADETPETLFPRNVIFRAKDWVENSIPEDEKGYDVILALSVAKWIHLNQGDDGLIRFFRRVWQTLRPGGRFVLEPQAWDGYAKAKRMHPRLKESYHALKLRPDGFEEVLQSIGFGPKESLGMTGEGGFRRPVDVYTRPAN